LIDPVKISHLKERLEIENELAFQENFKEDALKRKGNLAVAKATREKIQKSPVKAKAKDLKISLPPFNYKTLKEKVTNPKRLEIIFPNLIT
jgi:hypothetical protein